MLDRSFFTKHGRATAVVTEMAVTVVLGVYFGSYFDTWLGLSPVLLLSFTLGAHIVGMVRLTRSVQKLTATVASMQQQVASLQQTMQQMAHQHQRHLQFASRYRPGGA